MGAKLLCLCLAAAVVSACDDPAPADCGNRCQPNEICFNGKCAVQDFICAATQPCPDGMHCCGGLCYLAHCCILDRECSNGFCQGGVCQKGVRDTCSETDACEAGRCLFSTGTCVECIHNDDCPVGFLCNVNHVCVPPSSVGCTNDDCANHDWAESCRPPFYEGPVGDANFDLIAYSLGRQAVTWTGTFAAIGVTPVCMPK